MNMGVPTFEIRSTDNDGKLMFVGAVPRGLTGYANFVVSLVSTRIGEA